MRCGWRWLSPSFRSAAPPRRSSGGAANGGGAISKNKQARRAVVGIAGPARRGIWLLRRGVAPQVLPQVAPQVGVDGERRVVLEARAVDLKVLHHTLHVVAGLHERDALDPVDGIELRVAR